MTETQFEKLLSSYIPLPMCIVNEKGKIVCANSHIGQVFLYDGIKDADFFALTGIKTASLSKAADEGEYLSIERNDRCFKLVVTREEGVNDADYLVYFYDITNFEILKLKYNNEKICVCKVNIDNYDELIASTAAEKRMSISTEVDKLVRQWAGEMNASINKDKEYEYLVYFQKSNVQHIIENRFSVLDEVRQIETEADFPMSLSIGLGIGGKNIAETEKYANTALDLALGRGGDQAVVKRQSEIEYFGGTMQTVEKGNKGKSRVVAHALKQLIEQSEKVIIMGHHNPDMDAFGAALGVYRICQMCKKESYILINETNDSMQEILRQARESEKYKLINNVKAEELVTYETLLVIVDTHRPSYMENPDLLSKVERTVVIDHHRRAEDGIENPTLSYIESYASSTCELVTEMVQYIGDRRTLDKLEAEALLAGMTVDTNRFAVKTGVRTFEAAAWLRRAGADTTEVKRFFQTDFDAFRVRATCIAAANIGEDGVATSICAGCNQDAQIINSQVADELLTIKGVRATFVSGRDERGNTVVSARSLGEMNVQVIMEKLGGGGHLTTAGAQVDCSPEEVIDKIRKIIEETAF